MHDRCSDTHIIAYTVLYFVYMLTCCFITWSALCRSLLHYCWFHPL